MLKKLHIFILCFGLNLILVSCEREKIVLDYLNDENKAAVACFLSEDQGMVTLKLTQSSGVIGKPFGEFNDIKDANVNLTNINLNKSITLTYNETTQYYEFIPDSAFVINSHNYKLNINGNDLNISARCMVPAYSPDLAVKLTLTTKEEINEITNYTFNYSITDQKGISNYYRLIPLSMRIDTSSGNTDTQYTDLSYGIENLFISDKGADGAKLNGSIKVTNTNDDFTKFVGIKLLVINCDEAYFKYHQKISSVQFANNINEPVIYEGNISGGLGVFGAYSNIFSDFILLD